MLTRWSPVREMANMQRIMDRFFEDWRPYLDENGGSTGAHALALDVHEDDKNYTISTELPGVQPEHVQVRYEGDTLIIEGEIPMHTDEQQGKRTIMQERRYGRYSRRLRLPFDINFDGAEANFDNGVLTLTLPKAEAAQPKMIPIKTGKG
jgi:HSP20 family protein